MNPNRSLPGALLLPLLLLVFSAPRSEGGNDLVPLPDPALEASLRIALDKPTGDIIRADMESLEIFLAPDSGIFDLSGLDYAINLRELDISGNRIGGLATLNALTILEELDVSRNPLGGLSFFPSPSLRVFRASGVGLSDFPSGFPHLEVLDVSENLIDRLDGLNQPSSMREVDISGNPIYRLNGIQFLPNLEKLDASRTAIEDLQPLADAVGQFPNLETLSIANTAVADLEPLELFPTLQLLDLTNVPGTEVEALGNLPNLVDVTLQGMFLDLSAGSNASAIITSLEADGVTVDAQNQRPIVPVIIPDHCLEDGLRLSGPATTLSLARLSFINVEDDGVQDLRGLEHAYNVKQIDLEENYVTDLSPIAGLQDVVFLDLCDNRIADLSPIASMTGLRRVDLEDNRIWDLSPLASLVEVVSLDLGENQIHDIEPLRNLPMLLGLSLGENPLFDIEPLSGLSQLVSLWASAAGIQSLEPLRHLRRLESINLEQNSIRSLEPLRDHTELDFLLVRENDLRDISALDGKLGYFDFTYNFLDLTAGSDDRDVIDDLLQAGQDIRYEPQLPDGPVMSVPLTLERLSFDFIRVSTPPTDPEFFYQLRRSTDLINWRKDPTLMGNGTELQQFLFPAPGRTREFIQVLRFGP